MNKAFKNICRIAFAVFMFKLSFCLGVIVSVWMAIEAREDYE